MNEYTQHESLRKTQNAKPPIYSKSWIWCIYITEAIKAAATYELLSRWGILYLNFTELCVLGLTLLFWSFFFLCLLLFFSQRSAKLYETFVDSGSQSRRRTHNNEQQPCWSSTCASEVFGSLKEIVNSAALLLFFAITLIPWIESI